ncbi:MAG: hypothetical protein QE487_11410 [Fluviicola sp.]|nr:hypothetical protein [Fluviicola sp.]
MKLNLTKNLKNGGYDLIGSITRNHKPLQIWEKKAFNEIDLLEDISKVFKSEVTLHEIENPGLNVDFLQKDEFNLNVGASALDVILSSFGLGDMNLATNLAITKTISIGFTDTYSVEYKRRNLEDYFNHDSIDFSGYNKDFYLQLRRDNFYLISGVIYAKGLEISLETETAISAEIEAEFMKVIDGNIEFSKTSQKQINLRSNNEEHVPVAVKVHRLRYNGETFRRLEIVSDTIDLF